MKEAIDHYQRLNGWMRTYCCPYLPWIKVGFGRGGPTANRTEWPVFDELPAVQAHRFLEAATAACGRMGEVANGRFGAFNFKNSGFIERPVSGNLDDRNGHGNAGRLFGFIAGKRTLNSASRKQPVVTECSDP
jgi:hypothetical protein